MPTSVDLCNRALGLIAARGNVASLDEQSAEAYAFNRVYGGALDEVLRWAPWEFARASLIGTVLHAAPYTPENPGPAFTPAPGAGWLYSYLLPADCIKMRQVTPTLALLTSSGPPSVSLPRPCRWTRAEELDADSDTTEVIQTNQAQATLIYTARVQQPDRWDALFQETLVLYCASLLATDLTGDKMMAAKLAQDAMAKAGVDEGQTG